MKKRFAKWLDGIGERWLQQRSLPHIFEYKVFLNGSCVINTKHTASDCNTILRARTQSRELCNTMCASASATDVQSTMTTNRARMPPLSNNNFACVSTVEHTHHFAHRRIKKQNKSNSINFLIATGRKGVAGQMNVAISNHVRDMYLQKKNSQMRRPTVRPTNDLFAPVLWPAIVGEGASGCRLLRHLRRASHYCV